MSLRWEVAYEAVTLASHWRSRVEAVRDWNESTKRDHFPWCDVCATCRERWPCGIERARIEVERIIE